MAEQRLLATPAQKHLPRADEGKLTSGTLPDTISKKSQTIEMKVPNPQIGSDPLKSDFQW